MLFRLWVEAGQNPDSFWDKTPREVHIIMQCLHVVEVRRHNERAWLVWHIAKLSRAKKIPALKKLQSKLPRRQTWHEDAHNMDLWVVATRHLAAKQPTTKV